MKWHHKSAQRCAYSDIMDNTSTRQSLPGQRALQPPCVRVSRQTRCHTWRPLLPDTCLRRLCDAARQEQPSAAHTTPVCCSRSNAAPTQAPHISAPLALPQPPEAAYQGAQDKHSAYVGSRMPRRQLLRCLSAAAAGWTFPTTFTGGSALSLGPAGAVEALAVRLEGSSLKQFGSSPFKWTPKQAYFPKWLFGEWDVKAKLKAAQTPLGREALPKSLEQGLEPLTGVPSGAILQFRQRWYSTLPDTLENNFKVQVGILPSDAIIADTAFNTKAWMNALAGFEAVTEVDFSPREPDRITVNFSDKGADDEQLPLHREELYLQQLHTQGEGDEFVLSRCFRKGGLTCLCGALPGSVVCSLLRRAHQLHMATFSGGPSFRTCCQKVVLGVRAVDAVDYEIVTRLTRTAEDAVTVTQRVAGYQQPQQKADFKAKGQAVYLRDSSWDMLRVPPPVDATGAAACVETPKGFTQCL